MIIKSFKDPEELKIYIWETPTGVLHATDDKTIKKTMEHALSCRAKLAFADLSGANLFATNLTMARLYGADLGDANLRNTNLGGADLRGANLRNANLADACLGTRFNPWGAKLHGADLSGACLDGITGYTCMEGNMFFFELCEREHRRFTGEEKEFIRDFKSLGFWKQNFFHASLRFGKIALDVMEKIKDAGWGEYYNRYEHYWR